MNYRKHRNSLGLDQREYWGRIGLTQSTGSRYETGRTPHKTIRMLHTLAYGKEREITRTLKSLGVALPQPQAPNARW